MSLEPLPIESLETVACELCGGVEAQLVLEGEDLRRKVPGSFRVVRCEGCGLAYVNPRPTSYGIGRYYPPDYAPHETAAPSALEALYYRVFRDPGLPRGSRILDVGCGGGKYLHVLRDSGYEVAGTDVNAEVVRELSDRFSFETYAGTLPEAEVPEGRFDAVTLWWVLEHTHTPTETLRAAFRALRPGGRLIVSVQNFASLGRLTFGSSWHHLDLPGHLYQFEPNTLSRILELTGFEVERIRQDLIAKDAAPSLGYALGIHRSLDRPVPNLLALPFDLLSWALGHSGLITAYAMRPWPRHSASRRGS